jgi:hypothetical protein
MVRGGRARLGKNGNGHGRRSSGRPVVLDRDELALVLTACRRYRQSVPVYLASSQPELRLIRSVIRKLS